MARAVRIPQPYFARRLRRNPTTAEAALWPWLRKRRLGVKALRQRPMLGFTLDFYIAAWRLAIELDGPGHAARRSYDQWRDRELYSRLGIRTLRLSNMEVLQNTKQVIEKIKDIGKYRQ